MKKLSVRVGSKIIIVSKNMVNKDGELTFPAFGVRCVPSLDGDIIFLVSDPLSVTHGLHIDKKVKFQCIGVTEEKWADDDGGIVCLFSHCRRLPVIVQIDHEFETLIFDLPQTIIKYANFIHDRGCPALASIHVGVDS